MLIKLINAFSKPRGNEIKPLILRFSDRFRAVSVVRLLSDQMASDLFQGKDIADAYADFRPVYPSELKSKILDYSSESTDFQNDLAVDIGCGSGQSTLLWADSFKHVLGTDISQAQIEKAKTDKPNVLFKVGKAEEIAVENASVDLITIAQAMHWVDAEKFYSEVQRALKPDGVLAVYGYGNLRLDKPEATDIISKEFYHDTLHSGKYWEPGRNHIDNQYAEFTPLPFRDFKRIDSLEMAKQWSIDHFIGYVSSWSGYRAYIKQHPDANVLQQLKERLKSVYNKEDTLRVAWPVFILLGRK